jgi:trk system potassium uptake protein TrkH
LFLQVLRGRPGPLWYDAQVRLYIGIVFFSALTVAVWLAAIKDVSLADAVRWSTFAITSVISSTGFTSPDFNQWGAFPLVIILSLMLAGGCTGSSTGGIKMFRLCVLLEHLRVRLHLQVFPHASAVLLYNREPVPVEVRAGVTNYFFIFIASFFILALALSATGLSFEESLSAAASALGNFGPGFGPVIGPCCTYAPIPDAAKWLMFLGMFAGRLEILIVVLPLTRTFWRD